MLQVPPDDTPIRIVCATRVPAERFFLDTHTGRTLAAFKAISNAELSLYPNNSTALSAVYNHAIELTREAARILVFIHDDCVIADYFWAQRIRDGLRQFDLLGVVGNVRRVS